MIIKVCHNNNNNNNNNKLSVGNASSINRTIYYYNSKKENELKTNKRKQRPGPVIRVNIMMIGNIMENILKKKDWWYIGNHWGIHGYMV